MMIVAQSGSAMNTVTTEARAARLKLSERIKAVAIHDWCHQFEIGEQGNFLPAENLSYRLKVLREVFQSLVKGKSVLVLNEVTGFYPVMIRRAGACSVRANNASRANCE